MQADDRRADNTSGADCPAERAGQPQKLDKRIEQVLKATPLPEFAAPEPACEHMLARAYSPAGPRAAFPQLSRRRWALVLAITVAAVAATTAITLWPLKLHNGSGGIGLDTATAWAAAEGYVIDFDLLQQRFEPGEIVPEGLDVHALTESEIIELGLDRCSQILFARVLEDWIEAHTTPDGLPLLVTNQFSGLGMVFKDDDFFVANVSFTLLSDDQVLLDDLLATLTRLPGVSTPRVYDETVYFSEKFPGLYTPDRKVIVNGDALNFPSEIPDAYLRTIHSMFTHLEKEIVYYRAHWSAFNKSDTEPLVAGDVIEIRFNDNGDMVINTIAEEWDSGYIDSDVRLSVYSDEINGSFDPLEVLQQKADMMNDQSQFLPENWDDTPNHILKFNLFTKERLRNVFAQNLTAAELQHSRDVYERMRSAYIAWLDHHPELHRAPLKQGKSHIKKPATFGDGVLQVKVQLKTADEQLLDELVQLLIEASGGIEPDVSSSQAEPPTPAKEGGQITLMW